MTRKRWVEASTQTILPAAFFRRPAPKDESGLSVDVVSPGSCVSALRESFGVASLHVGRIRDLGLDVVVDDHPHANITGVPYREEDTVRAERLATQMARQARFIPPEGT